MQTIKNNFFCITAATLLSLLSGPGLAQNVTQPAAAESRRIAAKTPSALHSLQEAIAIQRVEAPIALSIGKSVVLPIDGGLARVSIANPEIADITLIRSGELYAVGKRSGSTNIFLWKKSGELIVMDIVISADTTGLIAKLRELMPTEDKIRVSSAGDTLVLLGQVADAVKVQRAVMIAEQFTGKRIINLLGIGEVPQVLLEVKVAEVSKNSPTRLVLPGDLVAAMAAFPMQSWALF